MGFLDKLKKKKTDAQEKQEKSPATTAGGSTQPQNSRGHIKKYTSDGKPVNE
jgi:hypothetical protein